MSTEVTVEQMDIAIGRFMNMEGTDKFLALNYKYHSDWNQLMAVISKIQKLGYKVVLTSEEENGLGSAFGWCDILKNDKYIVDGVQEKEIIKSAHKAVYDFIQFYNTTKQG